MLRRRETQGGDKRRSPRRRPDWPAVGNGAQGQALEHLHARSPPLGLPTALLLPGHFALPTCALHLVDSSRTPLLTSLHLTSHASPCRPWQCCLLRRRPFITPRPPPKHLPPHFAPHTATGPYHHLATHRLAHRGAPKPTSRPLYSLSRNTNGSISNSRMSTGRSTPTLTASANPQPWPGDPHTWTYPSRITTPT